MIVKAAISRGMAGATVLEGILGAGRRGVIRESTLSIAKHVPMIVEIVDTAPKIADFISESVNQLMIGGMLTLERAAVIMYRPRSPSPPGKLALAGSLEPLSTVPDIQLGANMTINESGVLLRVFIGESDKFENKPLYEAIVAKAMALGGAGATVLRGAEGFGANSVVHRSAFLEMSTDLPIVIEIVDSKEKIEELLPHMQTMVREGMITMEEVKVVTYRSGKAEK
jgi:PII-like signaling protein